MSQILTPIDGGIEEIQSGVQSTPGFYLSPQFVEVRKLQPRPTEWNSLGRPIYDRLPAASERYKLYFGWDNDTAYTYIAPGFGTTGPGSMQVQKSGNGRYLTIQGGSMVWEYGNIKVNPVIIDLEQMDMRSTRYVIGYQLYYDDSVEVKQYSVTDFSPVGYEMSVVSSTDSVTGWRYSPVYAFTDLRNRVWKNRDPIFPGYTGDAYLAWQTKNPNILSKIRLKCPESFEYSGTATLYYQTCPVPVPGETYCSSPSWIEQYTVPVQQDSSSRKFFEFEIQNPTPQNGWKVEWSNPNIEINSIELSGILSLERKPASATTYYQLFAYPLNAVPSTIEIDGKIVPLVICNLAQVDINSSYDVEKISDLRQLVYNDYQPVADWLTKPWDSDLIKLYTQFKNYPETWMNPQTCLIQEYAALSKKLVKVEGL